MNQSIPSSKETTKPENDSYDRKGVSDVETTASSDVSSFYEINVHENCSSESNTSKGSSHFYVRPKLMVKVKKVGGNKEGSKENNHNTHSFVENLKKIANPLIESYYPFLEEHQIGNITIEVNVSPSNSDSKEVEESKDGAGKESVEEKGGENSESSMWNKSNESATSDSQEMKEERKLALSSFNKIRKKLKRQILQDFLTRRDGEFKDLEWKNVEQDQLHIHHHEHHHHYYMNTAKFKDESEFSLLRDGSTSPVYWPEDKENDFRRSDILNADFDVKERERSNYLYDCSRQHPVNFLMGKNSCNLSNLTFVKRSKEEYMKIAEKYSSRSESFKPMKKASSMDSFCHKKSNLLVFHNYSDTELSRCDSEEGSLTDVPSSRSAINEIRNMKKSMNIENAVSQVLRGEREVVAGNVTQGNDSNSTVLEKLSDKNCDENKKTYIEIKKMNKKAGNVSVEKLKAPEKKNEDSKRKSEISVAKNMRKSVDVKTDKETSDENVTSTSTVATSANDTATVVKTSEEGSCNSRERCSRSRTPKSAGNSGDKMRSSSRKKIDKNEQVPLKSKQTFGISGKSKSKGVVDCYYSCSRNRECNITLTLEKNRKRATESSKSSESSKRKRNEKTSAR